MAADIGQVFIFAYSASVGHSATFVINHALVATSQKKHRAWSFPRTHSLPPSTKLKKEIPIIKVFSITPHPPDGRGTQSTNLISACSGTCNSTAGLQFNDVTNELPQRSCTRPRICPGTFLLPAKRILQ